MISKYLRILTSVLTAISLTATVPMSGWARPDNDKKETDQSDTKTPIKHVVVIFQENVSFDHYFGTYPYATNTDGNNFTAAQGTPAVNGLNFSLLGANPNESNPQRLGSSIPGQLTCDQDHDYSDE